jgi:DNA-directed RNA polymerase specialized sigma24 family protein
MSERNRARPGSSAGVMVVDESDRDGRRVRFERDIQPLERTLRRAFVARYGLEVGAEVTAETLGWAWEHWELVAVTQNAAGYLYRVGQTAARRHVRWARRRVDLPIEPRWDDAPSMRGDVFDALARLKPDHRVAVLLVHGYAFTYREVADLLGVSEAAVTNYVHRGLAGSRVRRRYSTITSNDRWSRPRMSRRHRCHRAVDRCW